MEIDAAPFGMIALETAIAQVVTFLIRPGILTWSEAFEKMSLNPAKLLGQNGGSLENGKPADFSIIDPERRWKVDATALQSKSYNTPLNGSELFGLVMATFVGGRRRWTAKV